MKAAGAVSASLCSLRRVASTKQRSQSLRGLSGAHTAPYDVVIVGAGVLGCSIAHDLAKRGWRTLNIDQGGAAGHGSTSASCAVIRTMYSHIDSTKMAYEGYRLWTQWSDHIAGHDEDGPVEFREVPYVLPRVPDSAEFQANCQANHDELRFPYTFVDNQTLKERFPYMDTTSYGPPQPLGSDTFGEPTGEINGAFVIDTATGFVSDPVMAAHNLQHAAQGHGGRFLFHTSVTGVLKTQGRASGVQLADGSEVHARVVINAAGPWSSALNKIAFNGDCPADDSVVRTQPMVAQVAYPPGPPELDYNSNGCIVTDFDVGVYFRPANGNRLCIGSIEPKCDTIDILNSTYDFVDELSDPAQRQMYRAGLRMPTLPIPNSLQGVSHMYDKSDDFTPIYDKTALRGYYTAIGTSGNQFKNCGIVGHIMAELVVACENGHDHDQDPLQVLLPITQQTMNLGTFSRLRCKDTNVTSHSVLG